MCKPDIKEALRRDALVIQKERGTQAAAQFMRDWYFTLREARETLVKQQSQSEGELRRT